MLYYLIIILSIFFSWRAFQLISEQILMRRLWLAGWQIRKTVETDSWGSVVDYEFKMPEDTVWVDLKQAVESQKTLDNELYLLK